MIIQAHFNRDFIRKNPLPAQGFEPMTFQQVFQIVRPSSVTRQFGQKVAQFFQKVAQKFAQGIFD